MEKIIDYLSYIPASEAPLSADVGIVFGENSIWLYDVGFGNETLEKVTRIIAESKGEKKKISIIISHFHEDHMGNLAEILSRYPDAEVYAGAFTLKHIAPNQTIAQNQTTSPNKALASNLHIVDDDIYINDGITLHIFPIPSCHAKGVAGLEINTAGHEIEGYALIGDAVYSCMKNGKKCYNASLLNETIECLKKLPAKYLLLSHQKNIIREKNTVINWLEKIYKSRRQGEQYINI